MIWGYGAHNLDERLLLVKLLKPGIPVIITDLKQRIVAVNTDWVDMCKYTPSEAIGETPKILQGNMTDLEVARGFSFHVCAGHPVFVSLINYKKDDTPFINHLYGWSLGDLLVAETHAQEAVPQFPSTDPAR